MHLLPTSLAKLADVSDARDSTRFSLSSVHIRVHGDNTFIAEATDSKRVLRVTGPCLADPNEFPSATVPNFDAAPNSGMEALIPASGWREVFSRATKITKSNRKPEIAGVAVKIGKDATTFGAVDTFAAKTMCETVRHIEGRYPPIADIMGQCQKNNRLAFAADPVLLAELLRAMIPLIDESTQRVEFLVGDKPGKPVLVKGFNPSLCVEGLILERGTRSGERGTEEPAGSSAPRSALRTPRSPRDALQMERDQFTQAAIEKGAEVTELRSKLAAREDRIAELLRTIDTIQHNALCSADRGAGNAERRNLPGLPLRAPSSPFPAPEHPGTVRPAPVSARTLSRRERLQGV